MLTGIDERFLDRHGCGDEFYLDSRLKLDLLIDGLRGIETFAGADFGEEDFDDSANH